MFNTTVKRHGIQSLQSVDRRGQMCQGTLEELLQLVKHGGVCLGVGSKDCVGGLDDGGCCNGEGGTGNKGGLKQGQFLGKGRGDRVIFSW